MRGKTRLGCYDVARTLLVTLVGGRLQRLGQADALQRSSLRRASV